MRNIRMGCIATGGVLLIACGGSDGGQSSSKGSNGAGAPDSGGPPPTSQLDDAGGTPGTKWHDAGTDGEATGEVPGLADYETLETCNAPAPCLVSLAQRIDGYPIAENVQRADCVLEGLAQRTPGIYHHDTDHSHGAGSERWTHLMRVHDDGSVSYAIESAYWVFDEDGTSYASFRCQLAEAAYFEACLDIVTSAEPDLQARHDCVYAEGAMDQWLSSCEPAPARCE